MKTILILAGIAIALSLGACSKQHNAGDISAAKELYTCPMHPSVISDRPGVCPVCGMALVKKSALKPASDSDVTKFAGVSLSPTQRVLANVTTVPAARRTINRDVTAVGVVDFAEPLQATVAARFRGRIEKLNVSYTGESVRKGEPLAELYSPDLISAQQDYLIALDGMENAATPAQTENRGTQQSLAAAAKIRLRTHYGLTAAQIADLEKSREVKYSATFYSPIHGTVLKKEVQEGQFVEEGTTMYRLADLSRVWVYLDVYEKDLRFIRPGQAVAITAEAYPGEMFNGRVTFIEPVMNAESRTVRVRTEFPNSAAKLKPNMFVKATVRVPAIDVLVVPTTAILATGRRNVVWVEAGKERFEPRDVITGGNDAHFTEILSGLREGERVVETGGFLIDSESQLQQPAAQMKGMDHGKQGTQEGMTPGMKMPAREKRGEGGPPGSISDSGEQEISIRVEYGYFPSTINVVKGKRVRLLFDRREDSSCSEEILFNDFGIRKKLPAFKTTAIEFTPSKAGTYTFNCGMKMLFGKLVVAER